MDNYLSGLGDYPEIIYNNDWNDPVRDMAGYREHLRRVYNSINELQTAKLIKYQVLGMFMEQENLKYSEPGRCGGVGTSPVRQEDSGVLWNRGYK